MAKPHEQMWKQGRDTWSIRDAKDDGLRAHVYTDDQTPREADDVARLIAAAPDMARALMGFVRSAETGRPDMLPALDDAARAALRKAGVLP